MKILNNNLTIFILFISIGLLLGIIATNLLTFKISGDEYNYDKLAINLLRDKNFSISPEKTHFHPPGYIIFLAVAYNIIGYNHTIIYLIQFIMLGTSAFLIYLICIRHFIFTKLLAIIASIFVLFWPYLVLHALLLLTETLYVLLLISFVYCLLEFIKKPSLKLSVIIGLLIGYAAITRFVAILLPAWILIFLLLWFPIYRKRINLIILINNYFKKIIIAAIIFLFIYISWISHMSLVSGHLYILPPNIKVHSAKANTNFEYKHYKTPGYEPGQEITFKKQVATKLKNIYRFWNPGASGYQAEYVVEKFPIMKYAIIFYRIFFYILLSLGFLSIFYIKKNKNIFILWIIISYFWAVHSMLFPYPRYTMPLIPFMIILAIYSIKMISKKFKIKNTQKTCTN